MAKIDLVSKAIDAYKAKDYKDAYSVLRKATKESPEAAYYLGMMYYHGYYVDKDDIQAFENFKLSWEGLYPEGIYMLGRMYEEGRGVKRNYEQAFKLYQAALNSDNALLRMANFYEYGKYVNKSLANAIKIYNELQKKNNAFAMYKIGTFYLNGDGLKKDLNNAYKWLNKALLAGSIEAMNYFRILGTKSKTDMRNTGDLYKAGKALVEKLNIEEAWPYLEAAAKERYLPAVLMMHDVYRNGLGVDPDFKLAFEVLKKYEGYNESKIYYLLGLAYENGEGVYSSYPQAVRYYQLGADLNCDECIDKLKEIRGY